MNILTEDNTPKTRRYWHYYYLKRDVEFKEAADTLRDKISIQKQDGSSYLPTDVKDYDYFHDPKKADKLKLIKDFQKFWNIHWSYVLLTYLLCGDENFLPPSGKSGTGVAYDKDRNMLIAQIPLSASKEELDKLWDRVRYLKAKHGIDVTKKPRKKIKQESGEKAYMMWKTLRDTGSWTKVTKVVDEKCNTNYEGNIKNAKDFLKSNGYFV